ncbi:GlyGly-CTERM sorting domain-containing protein [Agarivorans sp. Alg241-V36]|uniref:GlyGly-CTERM sorting domain-containing protein n=1 Tax=Agarivorans sp. Alg241-V36 TaxID=2305992 RepID=UPI0013D29D18|nr:GlyGly-CTERM sorting domain-containing protein [Agarivorans sp. Alg241-V36]
MKIKLLTAAIAAGLALPLSAATLITSFEYDDYSELENNPEFLQVTNQGGTTYTLSTEHATDGVQSISAEYTTSNEPILVWNWGAWDWSAESLMSVDVTNPSDQDINFSIKLIDQDAANDWNDQTQTSIDYFTVPANTTETFNFNLDGGGDYQTHGEAFDKNKVLSVQFALASDESAQLFFDNITVGERVVTPPPSGEATNAPTAPVQTLQQVESFETIPDYMQKEPDVVTTLTESSVTEGEKALDVMFGAAYTSIRFLPDPGWDWSNLGAEVAIAIDVTNPSAEGQWVHTRVNSNFGQQDVNRGAWIGPGETKTIFTSLNDNAPLNTQDLRVSTLGLRDIPATASANVWDNDWVELDKRAITAVRYFSDKANVNFIFDNMRVINDLSHVSAYAEIADAMGQNNHINFAGKISSKEKLSALSAPEMSVLGELTNRNEYGGNPASSPSTACVLATPASFNACKDAEGNWQLVDPAGNAFFSTGLDNIRLADTYTMTGVSNVEESEVRKAMFTETPADYVKQQDVVHSGPVASGEAVSFYGSNLTARHGGEETWRDITVKRMKDWGFNTLGNWTDPAFYDNGSVPYVANGWVNSGANRLPVKQIGNGYWGPLPDPWDANFATNAATMAGEIKAQVSGNEGYLLGIFVDNEMSWGSVDENVDGSRYAQTLAVFNTDGTDAGTSPAKNSFIYFLSNDRYPDGIADLNTAWGTSYASWDAMRPAEELAYVAGMEEDLQYLAWQFAFQYFNTVKTAVKAELPNHMYLGSRFADWGRTPDVVSAASAVVDVLSYNVYKESIAPADWDADALSQIEAIDKPVIIGEFHFGALDSGLYGKGIVSADSQEDRAEKMVNFFESVNAHKNFVGAHWFQYIDSPITGRTWDGENYNVGFVSVTDTPYTPLSDAARVFNCGIYGDDCSDLSNNTGAETAGRADPLYTGANIGVVHSGEDIVDPPTPPTGSVTGGGGSAGWLSLLGLVGVFMLRRRKV